MSDATGARFDGITIAIAWTTLFLALVFTPFPRVRLRNRADFTLPWRFLNDHE